MKRVQYRFHRPGGSASDGRVGEMTECCFL